MESVNERHIAGAGTPESVWMESFTTRNVFQGTVVELLANSKTVHIIAPHPDDEILACGGIIQQLAQMKVSVQIVAVTDGEASHPGSCRWPASMLAAARRAEVKLATRMLAPQATRTRLQFADGGVSASENELTVTLSALLDKNDIVIVPWRLDGHPDHEAVGRAGCKASAIRGCRLFEVPIWGWHWASPNRREFPWHRVVSIALSPEERYRKEQAIRFFRTQTEPDPGTGRAAVLPRFALERFRRPFEVVFR
ncbi:PIG-L deacetylase family protein [Pusillimonas sp. ANT_WB101]|uniref:PIG-L deacetylase family protein n=1 Tax=Pusillimonas sp. ANT_WB101 TaxID=2597356 RepID=UPI0011EE5981|nr:PIG-L deacetylase family protein [Pusillimonas sp. ANT_WB101]KAA0890806.1 PIG-L family deacetylase [Pusillimonas sp. ANT_WB101]